jgi:hypothetical protein
MWWDSLPRKSPLDKLWEKVVVPDQWIAATNSADLLVPPDEPAFQRWDEFLDPRFLATVQREIEFLEKKGLLDLESEGVGSGNELTADRNDSVCYLTGCEIDLMRHAPRFCILIQWLLGELPGQLSQLKGFSPLASPDKAMLACYRSPSGGFARHLDNPGDPEDNGRSVSVVLYLGEKNCKGGELAAWLQGRDSTGPPDLVLEPQPGSAVVFDSREIPHEVRPLKKGPDRWAVVLWMRDAEPQLDQVVPTPELSDLLVRVPELPLPAGRILFREFQEDGGPIRISVKTAVEQHSRAAVVCTIRDARNSFEGWCKHHFEIGFHHLIVVFDRPDSPDDSELIKHLRALWSPAQLTLWTGPEVAEQRWPELDELPSLARLTSCASGDSSSAVAARQALNASAALRSVRRGELGESAIDWLVHLDHDELFSLQGQAAGGSSLEKHFGAATQAGLHRIRYLNCELLDPITPTDSPRFKVNPSLAESLLGPAGWRAFQEEMKMRPEDRRPYFRGYANGKSAVAVAFGESAAGVHDWYLSSNDQSSSAVLAGPSILHFDSDSASGFRDKYLRRAETIAEDRLFEASPTEKAAVELVLELRDQGASSAELERALESLRIELSHFTEEETALMEEAGLLIEPL